MKSLSSKLLFLFYALYACSTYADENLNAAYAKLLALSLTDDISASKLNSNELSYDKYSLPYEFKNLYVTKDYFLSMKLNGNYLKIKSSPANIDSLGNLRAHWDVFSLSATPKITYPINEKFSIENELEFGYSNMNNKSSFHGNEQMKEILREEGLLDWSINTFHITPKLPA